jgi:hypothetical protein
MCGGVTGEKNFASLLRQAIVAGDEKEVDVVNAICRRAQFLSAEKKEAPWQTRMPNTIATLVHGFVDIQGRFAMQLACRSWHYASFKSTSAFSAIDTLRFMASASLM